MPNPKVDAAHTQRLLELAPRLAQVTLGMTRAEVGRLFTRANGGFGPADVTEYFEEPEIVIAIGYDAAGGEGSPMNRVTRLPRIRRGPFIAD